MDWQDARNHDISVLFTQRLTKLRAEHPIFRRRRFFQGQPVPGSKLADIAWLRRDGEPMTEQDWNTQSGMTMTVFLNGEGIPERDPLGEAITDSSFLVLFNPLGDGVTFTVPPSAYGRTWETVLDTADPLLAARKKVVRASGTLDVGGHAMVVLRGRY
jgi:glycogen operon protein